MESFRIVDFLSPIALGWIYGGRRTRKRTSASPRYLWSPLRDRKYKRILFKFTKSPFFARTRLARVLSENDRDPPSSRGEGRCRAGESISVRALFRIIDVKNILEALINVGREDIREGTAAPQQSHAKLLLDFNWKTIILVE